MCYLIRRQSRKMVSLAERVLVHFLNQDGTFSLARFTDSIMDNMGLAEGTDMQIYAELKNNFLHLGSRPWHQEQRSVNIRRPTFCPIHNLTATVRDKLPPDTLARGIDVGCATIVETSDNKILLTRRGPHLRTFPNVWVPPGGHVEHKETLQEAGLRELYEETGLKLSSSHCVNDSIPILALWESVFPAKLSAGNPKRHHAVVYLHVKLKPEYTSVKLQDQLRPDPEEVGATAWVERPLAEAIVKIADEETKKPSEILDIQHLPETISISVVNPDGTIRPEDLATSVLYQKAPESQEDVQRVSTGTKFALEEWLTRI